MGNVFPLLGKIVLQTKICASTSKNCVSTNGKNCCYRVACMFPLVGKKVICRYKLVFPLELNMLALRANQSVDVLSCVSALRNIVVFSTEGM